MNSTAAALTMVCALIRPDTPHSGQCSGSRTLRGAATGMATLLRHLIRDQDAEGQFLIGSKIGDDVSDSQNIHGLPGWLSVCNHFIAASGAGPLKSAAVAVPRPLDRPGVNRRVCFDPARQVALGTACGPRSARHSRRRNRRLRAEWRESHGSFSGQAPGSASLLLPLAVLGLLLVENGITHR
jgi:hypothetical protein